MPDGLWKAFLVFWALGLAVSMVLIGLGSELLVWAFAVMMGFGLLAAYGCYGVKGLLSAWPLALIAAAVSAGLFALGAPAVLVGALTGLSVGLSSRLLPDKPV